MSSHPSSRSLLARYRLADRIDQRAIVAMVACKYCVRHQLPCRLSSLHRKCSNCVRRNVSSCEPEALALPDYSKIDKEMARLESLEEKEEACLRVEEELAESALTRARQVREKLARLRKQKKLLRRKEQEMFDHDLSNIEELEALEELNQAVASVNPEAPLGAATVDWSPFWDVGGNQPEAGGNS